MNPHYEEAQRLSTEASLVNDWGLTERSIIAARAQAEATLALAYEQRTANLIALMAMVEQPDYDWLVIANNAPESPEGKQLAKWKAIDAQIERRLSRA